MFEGKTIVLGVTGSIAVYKAAELVREYQKRGADVHVVMTRSACEFVGPVTFETLTGHKVSVETFDRNFQWNVQHVALAKRGDVFVIAPATANIIAKMASGIADDMLSSTVLAARCPKLVAPAMNTGMYDNPATQRNLETLRGFGVQIVEPGVGMLACGDEGRGRLADLEDLVDATYYAMTVQKPLAGRRVVVTAGPTREALDPVRYVSNHSTGRMGYEMARAALALGAREVTLISGPTALRAPYGVRMVPVVSAREMESAVLAALPQADLLVKAAAVGDFRPASVADQKIKKGEGGLTVDLVKNPDILAEACAARQPGQVIVGFAMETQDLIANAKAKLEKKGADMIVANSLTEEGAGFGGETNVASLLTASGVEKLPKMSKLALSEEILRRAAGMIQ